MYSSAVYQSAVQDPKKIGLLVHDDGVIVPDLEKVYTTQVAHDPHDLDAAIGIGQVQLFVGRVQIIVRKTEAQHHAWNTQALVE